MSDLPQASASIPATQAPLPVSCFGAVHYDTIAHADRAILRETSTPACIEGKPGGVAANVARSLAKLGVPVSLTGMIGNDSAGRAVQQSLELERIDLNLTIRDGHSTGQYLALHDPDGSLAAACISDTVLTSAPIALFEAAAEKARRDGWWLLDANLPEPVLSALAVAAPQGRLAAEAVSIAKAPRLSVILPRLSVVFMNRAEAAALSHLPEDSSLDRHSSAILAQGALAAVITDGAGPLHLRTADQSLFLPSPEAVIVDVTGAGDALVAGTLAAIGRGLPLETAVRAGQQAARIALENAGAAPDALSWTSVSAPLSLP